MARNSNIQGPVTYALPPSLAQKLQHQGLVPPQQESIESLAAITSDGLDTKMEIGSKSDDQIPRHLLDNIIGRNLLLQSPFGIKAQVYADYTASGKALEFVERFIHDKVLTTYGDMHTTASVTGLQTVSFFEEARHIVARAVNASNSEHEATFVREDSHGAINKLIRAAGANMNWRRHRASKRPVIFTCSSSSHSTQSAWNENSCVDEVQIPETEGGDLDLTELQRQLERHQDRPLKLGCFDAASNLTGVLTDVDEVSRLLHQHGALVFWDYSSCAPYVDIAMNSTDPAASKDAIYFAGHKFLGGPGSCNVLVVTKKVMATQVAPISKGGIKTEFDDGCTRDVLGSIRLGLTLELMHRVGPMRIQELQRKRLCHARGSLRRNENIAVLGRRQTDDVDQQLPIFSLLFRFGDRFLHHNFVAALLSDLFGVQVDCGCLYASRSGRRLLGLTQKSTTAMNQAIAAGNVILVPSGTRISFPYFVDDAEVDYILEAVHFVADHGWKFLPQYDFSWRTGMWQHVSRAIDVNYPPTRRLSAVSFSSTKSPTASTSPVCVEDVVAHRRQNFVVAAEIADRCIQEAALTDCRQVEKVANVYEDLRWFAYPVDAMAAFHKFGGKPPIARHIWSVSAAK